MSVNGERLRELFAKHNERHAWSWNFPGASPQPRSDIVNGISGAAAQYGNGGFGDGSATAARQTEVFDQISVLERAISSLEEARSDLTSRLGSVSRNNDGKIVGGGPVPADAPLVPLAATLREAARRITAQSIALRNANDALEL